MRKLKLKKQGPITVSKTDTNRTVGSHTVPYLLLAGQSLFPSHMFSCMYISGVIRTIQECHKDLPEFQFVEVNGMKLTEPAQA